MKPSFGISLFFNKKMEIFRSRLLLTLPCWILTGMILCQVQTLLGPPAGGQGCFWGHWAGSKCPRGNRIRPPQRSLAPGCSPCVSIALWYCSHPHRIRLVFSENPPASCPGFTAFAALPWHTGRVWSVGISGPPVPRPWPC